MLLTMVVNDGLGKFLAALKSAICLKEKHPTHAKTAGALVKLFKQWLNMRDEDKLSACKADQRILAVAVDELAQLGCPADQGKLAAWFEANSPDAGNKPLAYFLETLKIRSSVVDAQPSADWGKQALAALTANP